MEAEEALTRRPRELSSDSELSMETPDQEWPGHVLPPVSVTVQGVLSPPPQDDAASTPCVHQWPGALPQLEPAAEQVVRVFCGVWNLHGKPAPADLTSWLVKRPLHHIYVIGTCECERTIEQSMLWANKSRWEQQVRDHFGDEYRMIKSHNMGAIHMMVFVHQYLWKYIWDIMSAQVATGFGNVVGNKGGTQIGFNIGRTSVLFINAHLAAHAHAMKERTQNMSRILADSPIKRQKATAGVHEEYDRVFFMGDLNSRVNAKRPEVDAWLANQDFQKLLERDQLLPLLHAAEGGPAGLWPSFEEAPIHFAPTYKFDCHSDRYDSSKKQRVPSWTDRILWKRDPNIRPMKYTSIPSMRCSDHKPVIAQFEIFVDLDDWETLEQAKGVEKKSAVCSVQ